MRTVTIEEHFISEALLGLLDSGGAMDFPIKELRDLGEGRIADMDANGIDFQVISSTAVRGQGAVTATIAQETNDELAEAVRAHSDRFAGFATLPIIDPEAAADELERAVGSLGFVGGLINGNIDGRFLDEPQFFPVLERAMALDVPLYIHPGLPPKAVWEAYYSSASFEPSVNWELATAAWGWHSEAGLHALRLVLSGVFDRLPTLQIVIGHMGEMIPFQIDRAAYEIEVVAKITRRLDRTVREYLTQNYHATTSGYFWQTPFKAALEIFGIDRVVFSIDYPYNTNEEGRAFLDSLTLSEADMEKFRHGNAERLLNLGTQTSIRDVQTPA